MTLILVVLVGVLTLGPPVGGPVMGGDKLHHLLGFAVLALPTALFSPRDLLVTSVLLILFGGGIELIQPFVGRSRELLDFLMDVVGVAIGAGFGLLVRRAVQRRTG